MCVYVCVCCLWGVPPPPPPAHQSSILKWDDSDWWWRCETRCASRITCLSHSCLPLPCSRSWLTEEKTLFLVELEITGHSDYMWPGLLRFENQMCVVFKPGVRSAVCEGRVKCAFIKAYSENTGLGSQLRLAMLGSVQKNDLNSQWICHGYRLQPVCESLLVCCHTGS